MQAKIKSHPLVIVIAVCSIATAVADTYRVTNTDPGGPGSLFQAISDADAHPNSIGVPDTIAFDIPFTDPNRNPATGVFTITPSGFGLMFITDAVVIDGYTQGSSTSTTSDDAKPNSLGVGSDAVLLIEVNGVSPMNGVSGLDFRPGSAGSTVRGLIINRFATGIFLETGMITVVGNFLGTDSAGGASLGNGTGIVASDAGGHQIGSYLPADRNLISGNGSGINLTNRSIDTNTVQNNYIGVNAAGNAALPNASAGIFLSGVFAGGVQGETVIGGDFSSEGNIISGNTGSGVFFNVGGGSVLGPVGIKHNFIGLGADGLTALGNGGNGIEDMTELTSSNGNLLILGNIISSNGGDGVLYASTNTTVQSNVIGTDIALESDRGNGGLGIEIVGDHRDPLNPTVTAITIGGIAPENANLISGNKLGGISLRNANALIEGNFIGVKTDGTSALGNGGDGIRVYNVIADPLLQVTVGGVAAGASNIIAHNAASGVHVESSTVTIQRNSIFSNGPANSGSQLGLGIDLGSGPGVTANDPGDSDTGPNGLQNFPVLTSVSVTTGSVNVLGSLESRPSTTYALEFFGNNGIDSSGFGEGQTFLGSDNVTTDASGQAAFNVTFSVLPGALRVTATATDPVGNTSELSASIGELQNISTRLRVQTGDNVLIGGFIVVGIDDKLVLIRGIGPSLGGVLADPLANPTLELHAADGALIATNDDWKSDQQAEIEATGIAPSDDLEAAIIASLPADGAGYTAILRGKNGSTGIGLVEAYDLDAAANSKLANISTRGLVETGDNAMIGGFILGGGSSEVLVRAIGPSLTGLSVAEAIKDPTLELHDASGMTVASNDNWKDTQETEIEATGIPPKNNLESAILTTLPAAAYTVIVRGKNDTTGVALVEIYQLN